MVEWFMRKDFAYLLGQKALQFDSKSIVKSVWPTWSLCHTPFSLYESDGWAYLWLHPALLPDFSWVDSSRLCQYREEDCPWRGNTMLSLQSVYCGVVDTRHIDDSLAIPFLYHEAFHAFQQQWMKNRWHNFNLWSKYPENDVENIALSQIENQILLSTASLSEKIATFASIRKFRLSRLSTEIADFEKKGLLVEGTASYIEKRVITILLQSFDTVFSTFDQKSNQEEIHTYVNKTALSCNTTGLIFRWFGIGYQLGTALDILLPGWKNSLMEKTILLEDLLEEFIPASHSVNDLLNRYHYNKIVESVEKEQRQKNQEIQTRINRILNATEYKLQIHYKDFPPTGFVFSPSDMVMVNEKIKLHTTTFGLQFSNEFIVDIKGIDVIEYSTEKYFECIFPETCTIKEEQSVVTIEAEGLRIHLPYQKFTPTENGYFIAT
jgi:hypothetical protein